MSSRLKGDLFPLTRRNFTLAAIAAGGSGAFWPTSGKAQGLLGKLATETIGELKDLKEDVRAEVAKLLAMEAYVYAFPLVITDLTRQVETATPTAGEYAASINQFARMRDMCPGTGKTWSGSVLIRCGRSLSSICNSQ